MVREGVSKSLEVVRRGAAVTFVSVFAAMFILSGTQGPYGGPAASRRSSRGEVGMGSVEMGGGEGGDGVGGGVEDVVDEEYPGTAVRRLRAVHYRVAQLSEEELSGEWEEVRQRLLWAGGLRNLKSARPGEGYTGHSFNDFNHCDLTTMVGSVASNENRGQVEGIAWGNQLGEGIRIASIPELGPGGSWSTCIIGSNKNPPADVAHRQFKSRIAFKLVWAPPNFEKFVLVDDAGSLLATGAPTGDLPSLRERQMNFKVVQGSKYATAAEKIA